MRYTVIKLTASLMIFTTCKADVILSRSDYLNLYQANFLYYITSRACSLNDSSVQSSASLNKLIAYGYKYNLHSDETLRTSQNIELYVRVGMDAYWKTAKVSCGEVPKYVNIIAQSVSRLD
jgi:hypothetical protein